MQGKFQKFVRQLSTDRAARHNMIQYLILKADDDIAVGPDNMILLEILKARKDRSEGPYRAQS